MRLEDLTGGGEAHFISNDLPLIHSLPQTLPSPTYSAILRMAHRAPLPLAISPKMQYWFCFTISAYGVKEGTVSKTSSLPSELQQLLFQRPISVGVKPMPSASIMIVYSGSGEMTTRWASGPSGLTISQTWARTPFIT